MQQREKLLAAGLLGAVAIWLGLPLFERTFIAPLDEREQQLTAVRDSVAGKELKELDLIRAKVRLNDAGDRSLPPDPLDAHRVYQEWLTDLTQIAGFSNVQMVLDRRTPKGKTYVAVPVTINAKATLEQVARFVFHFQRTDLLQRITRLDIDSPATQGNPLLSVVITAEGLAMNNARDRRLLFPRTTLRSTLAATGPTLTVDTAPDFPAAAPFVVKIGRELLTVDRVSGTAWTVTRGIGGSLAEAHASGSSIELQPRLPGSDELPDSLAAYQRLLPTGPFTKPAPAVEYRPRLASLAPQTVVRGQPWSLQLKVESWDPGRGMPVFEVVGPVPEGFSVDPTSGTVTWQPPADVPASSFSVNVVALDASRTTQAQGTLQLTLREANHAPVLQPVPTLAAYSGRPLEYTFSAQDVDEPQSSPTFSLSGTIPQGAAIAADTGKLTWTPTLELAPGDYPVTVNATDHGTPPLTASQTVTIHLEDDAALFTYLIGCIDEGGKKQAWLYNRLTSRRTTLTEGDQVRIADIAGIIVGIGRASVTIETGTSSLKLNLGESLRATQGPVALPGPTLPTSVTAPATSPTTDSSPGTPLSQPAESGESPVPDPTAVPDTNDSRATPEATPPQTSPAAEPPESLPDSGTAPEDALQP